MTKFGPTGQLVYERTYSRVKPDGERETWPETVRRVVDGNMGLVDPRHHLDGERDDLIEFMEAFKVIPAGRHLWASGVKGRQYLFNCHVAGWGEKVSDHFSFTFLRLMEGGGVGANYSNKYLAKYADPLGWGGSDEWGVKGDPFRVHIVCDPEHPDYQKMKDAGLISDEYVGDWSGAFEVEDSREGWAEAMVDLIDTYYRYAKNQNRVFDVSRVRPEGSRLKTFGGRASGPLPLAKMLHEVAGVLNARIGQALDGIGAMEIDHAIAKCVVSGGNRRSARMAIMHWDDPQIEDFISIKATTGEHWTTNISVEVDDKFWWLLAAGLDGVKGAYADKILRLISEGMLTNGEPGFWNSDLSNVGEPNPVIATNPCGEIPLEAWENCNLGHVNLAAFVDDKGHVDMYDMFHAHRLMTRFLIRATYGDVNDDGQAAVLARNRRIGVGHLGVASALAMTGEKYSEAPGSSFEEALTILAEIVDEESRAFAHQLRIPVPVKTRTVAPTGTIAKMPGVSEGIHPIFAKYFIRRIRFSTVDPDQVATLAEYEAQGYTVEDDQYAEMTKVVAIPTMDSLMADVERIHGLEKAEEVVQSAADLTLEEMVAFQAMYQRAWADNAVSYTVNVDPGTYTAEQLTEVIADYGPDLKGMTVFPEMSLPQAPYERISKADYELYQYVQVADGIDENCATGACPVR